MAEKSEKATPRRLREARKKGQVAKAQDFPQAFTFITSMCLILLLSSWLWNQLSATLVNTFALIPTVNWVAEGNILMSTTLHKILNLSLPFIGVTSLVGVIINFLIVGPVFSAKAMQFDLKKLNPITGIKNKFKLKTLVELIKSILKIFIAGVIIYWVVKKHLGLVIECAAIPPVGSALVVDFFLKKVVLYVGLFYLAVAVADLFFQKRQFAKEMMMEKFEVKQEYKDTEGNPEIKGKRRQLAQEIAYDEGPTAVRRARAVVTNPAHIAVGIGYNPDQYAAPYIVVMGMAARASMIIEAAEKFGIPIIRDVILAHQLFEEGVANRFIPESTYEAVAEVLRWVIRMEIEQGKGIPPS